VQRRRSKSGVKFALHAYDYDPDAASIGLQAAEALGVLPRACSRR
jgi:Cys-tRNA(Pro)/Cys-tRNA(Cys) deacylase